MRKKASIETTELRINALKTQIGALQEAKVAESRRGLFEPFGRNDSILNTSMEREGRLQFLLNLWRMLLQRQKEIALLAALPLWTVGTEERRHVQLLPDGKDSAQERSRRKLRETLGLSETQKQALLALGPRIQAMQRRLALAEVYLTTLGTKVGVAGACEAEFDSPEPAGRPRKRDLSVDAHGDAAAGVGGVSPSERAHHSAAADGAAVESGGD